MPVGKPDRSFEFIETDAFFYTLFDKCCYRPDKKVVIHYLISPVICFRKQLHYISDREEFSTFFTLLIPLQSN